MSKNIDLHTHSTFSDGTKTPEELITLAKEIGLEALALTDHDTCLGLDLAQAKAKELNIKFIRGCELSTRSELGELHILGLWIPKQCPHLEEKLAQLRQRRDERNAKIVERLNQIGLPLTIEEVRACAGLGSVGRPHIAQALVKRGYVPDSKTAFTEYLGAGCKAYIPKAVFKPEEAVKALTEVQATVCLAHPLLHHYPLAWMEQMLKRLIDLGLDAIEVWHTEHSEAAISQALAWAKKFNLGVSGGSDYHGERKPGVNLGCGRGNLAIPVEVLTNLEARRRSQGLPIED
ncbi:MAG: PHP domain-containing protein [Desulfovibrionaceae bacterium]|nr:PHP domain-containing protein [Desulfovibrionaceae bacterium]